LAEEHGRVLDRSESHRARKPRRAWKCCTTKSRHIHHTPMHCLYSLLILPCLI
jgi:hypothetical protein